MTLKARKHQWRLLRSIKNPKKKSFRQSRNSFPDKNHFQREEILQLYFPCRVHCICSLPSKSFYILFSCLLFAAYFVSLFLYLPFIFSPFYLFYFPFCNVTLSLLHFSYSFLSLSLSLSLSILSSLTAFLFHFSPSLSSGSCMQLYRPALKKGCNYSQCVSVSRD